MNYHILIIDDDDYLRGYLKKILDQKGYFTKTSATGTDALKRMESTTPDLIITDIIMPDMDGFELIQNIRNSYENIKIMAISGGGMIKSDVYLKMASKLKADCILKKPFLKDEFLETVSSLLQ